MFDDEACDGHPGLGAGQLRLARCHGERVGHKRVLCCAVAFYGFVGTAPTWLPALSQIVVSRALVGVAEAAIMTCSTALIGAYFDGARRGRYLALQTGTGFGFVLTPLTARLLREVRTPRGLGKAAAGSTTHESVPFGWGKLIWICTAPQRIGLNQGLASLANPLGALLFDVLRWRTLTKLTLAFALLSTGFFLIALLPG